MLHLFLKCIAVKCDKFISLAPAASSKDVHTFIVILAQLWLLRNHTELVNKPPITVAKKRVQTVRYACLSVIFC